MNKYLLFCLLSLLINIIVCIKMSNNRINKKTVIRCLIIENIGIIVGSKLLDIISNYGVYVDLIYRNDYYGIIINGFSYLGGMFGAFIGLIICSINTREDLKEICNVFIPNLLLIYAIAKIGCYFNGCCYGKQLGSRIIPIQLIESLVYFICYLIIIKEKNLTNKKIILFCLLFGITRFSLEFLSEKNSIGLLSLPQIMCLFLIIVGIFVYIKKSIIRK